MVVRISPTWSSLKDGCINELTPCLTPWRILYATNGARSMQRSTKPKSSIKFAAAVKLRSPGVRRVFVLGGCNKNLLDDLRLYLDSVLWAISSLRYAGASPCITL